ncbi:MAG: hypothetical protein LBN97_07410 [Oscillospiraceae bacterium]|jgi:mannose-6-phosphate isomerase|nr:hypothetical protein [Oscillospiraceae bacterium]
MPKSTEEELKLYDERTLGAFIYDSCSEAENLKRWRIPQKIIRQGDWGSEYYLIGPEQTAYFSFSRADIRGSVPLIDAGVPRVGIVLSGEGVITFDGGELPIKKGDELFLPYNIPGAAVTGDLSLILCYPEGTSNFLSLGVE